MVGYDDIEAFSLLRDGATLAGEVTAVESI